MPRFLALTCLVLFLAAPAAQSQLGGPLVNLACIDNNGRLECPMLEGSFLYRIQYTRSPRRLQHVRLHNQTGRHLQIDRVAAGSTEASFNEYCVNLDEFVAVASRPETGAVGCLHKDNGEMLFPALTWDPRNRGRGVTIPPGSTIFLSTNIDALVASGVPSANITFQTTIRSRTAGIMSFNQPAVDRSIPCNGVPDSTFWTPYRNDGTRSWKTDAATLYTVAPSGSVNAACIFVLNTSFQVRWSHCTGANRRGHVVFPRQVVRPGEYLAAQANHVCSSGAWDWAAYLHVYF